MFPECVHAGAGHGVFRQRRLSGSEIRGVLDAGGGVRAKRGQARRTIVRRGRGHGSVLDRGGGTPPDGSSTY